MSADGKPVGIVLNEMVDRDLKDLTSVLKRMTYQYHWPKITPYKRKTLTRAPIRALFIHKADYRGGHNPRHLQRCLGRRSA